MLREARNFTEAVKAAFDRTTRGQPEEQLKRPVCAFLEAVGNDYGVPTDTTPEVVVADGRPDIGILTHQLLCGYVELKAPLQSIDPDRMRGRNKLQWEKFKALPNLLYTNGREWRLYRSGELFGTPVSFSGEPRDLGAESIDENDALRLNILFRAFLSWHPVVPTRPREFARYLAPLTRLFKQDVADAVQRRSENLIGLRDEWRAYLFADFSDDDFADAYAQTVTYALLLARLEGANVADPTDAENRLRAHNSLLGRILRILTQEEVREDIKLGLDVLQRVLQAMDPVALQSEGSDPWLYFYEDFLHAYDPALARDAGVYYTPAEVVECQVTMVSQLLEERFGKRYSFASEGVTVLDPAVGTGTYLVAAIQHALRVVEKRAGAQKPARSVELAKNLVGFELLIGPYAVAHLRLTRELIAAAGDNAEVLLRDNPVRIYLSDTLESPNQSQAGTLVPLMHRPLVQERERARRVKADERVIVCIGNPPYDRQMEEGAARKGGWVRFGDQTQEVPLLEDFLAPARLAGQGLNLRSIYNDYVYFWRWALWKVFETRSEGDDSPGIVSFITGSSYLAGPGFVGMREYMRRCFDEMWVIDLGGDSLGTRREPNVFAIQTPVAITIGVRAGSANWDVPASVRYHRISGTRTEKLEQLRAVRNLNSLTWRECVPDWQAPFRPPLEGRYSRWPALIQLFPWQHNGAQFVRTWPIGPTRELLTERWKELVSRTNDSRKEGLKETRDRTIGWSSESVELPGRGEPCLADLKENATCPTAIRYAYRSFDRQWALYDARLGDYLKPPLWSSHGRHQIYLSTLLATSIGCGPSATFAADIPDLHHFRGSFGGKDLIPLFRDKGGHQPNITRGLLHLLSLELGREVAALDLFAYVAGVLGGTAFTKSFWVELETPGIRVPITKSTDDFERAVTLGRKYVHLATFGRRFESISDTDLYYPQTARVLLDVPYSSAEYPARFEYKAESRELVIGSGIIQNLSSAVWNYEVSGLRIVESWPSYRMRAGAGRRSSTLDVLRPHAWTATMTEELLEIVWALEAYVHLETEATEVLSSILAGDLFDAFELPTPHTSEQQPPRSITRPDQALIQMNDG